MPDPALGGLLQNRSLVYVPLPHGFEHIVVLDHSLQLPFTIIYLKIIYLFIVMNVHSV